MSRKIENATKFVLIALVAYGIASTAGLVSSAPIDALIALAYAVIR